MNKKIIGLILLLIIIVCAVVVGAYLLMSPYKTFSDEKIQVEIPSDVDFKVNKSNDGYIEHTLYYVDYGDIEAKDLSIFDIIMGIFNPNHEIEIILPVIMISIDAVPPNSVYYEESIPLKDSYIEEPGPKIDPSKHNYNGTIYNLTNQAGMPTVYGIIIFADANTLITLQSTDLDTVIHMAETFKLK